MTAVPAIHFWPAGISMGVAGVGLMRSSIIDNGSKAMSNGKGFYTYAPGGAEQWEDIFSIFNYQIAAIMSKYLFNAIAEETAVNTLVS